MMQRMTAPAVAAAKGERKLAMLTAYDYAGARLAEAAGVDMLLVGDSLAMQDLLICLAIVVAWLVVVRFIFPKCGIRG